MRVPAQSANPHMTNHSPALDRVRVADCMNRGILSCSPGQLTAEYGVSHLIVLDASSGEPVGVLSTLDIASAYAH